MNSLQTWSHYKLNFHHSLCSCRSNFISFKTNMIPVTDKLDLFRASQVALVVKNLPPNAGNFKRYGFDPWVGKIPWKRAWQPTPVFFAWRIPWPEEPSGLWPIELQGLLLADSRKSQDNWGNIIAELMIPCKERCPKNVKRHKKYCALLSLLLSNFRSPGRGWNDAVKVIPSLVWKVY